MKSSENRLEKDILRLTTNKFVEICRNTDNVFTRNRKMPLSNLLLSLLNRKGLTLYMELRNFNKFINLESPISKVGYLKQRMKLNPKAFMELSDFHSQNFYNEAEYVQKKKGYLILAADGSSINLPTTKETLSVYGNSSKKNTKPQATLGLSCLYDVMNKMILDCTINSCKFNEAKQAELHLEKLPSVIGTNKTILTLDRGYPSIPLFIRMMEKEQKFLVRLKSNDFKKEISQMETNDENVTILFDKTRIRHYIGTEVEKVMNEKKSISMRIVKVNLSSGITEILATNIEGDFDTEEIKQLYAMRWGIETAFDILKNKLEVENFTGTKPILIEQDIFCNVYLCNLIQDIVLDVEAEMKEQLKENYKHKMMVNRSLAIGILKDELIHIILEKDIEKKTDLFRGLISEIKRNIIPIRMNRQYKRTKGNLSGKFSNSRKRSF